MRCKLRKSLTIVFTCSIILYTVYFLHNEREKLISANTKRNEPQIEPQMPSKDAITPLNNNNSEFALNTSHEEAVDIETGVSESKKSWDMTKVMTEITEHCSLTKLIEHNGADIQVSSLVEQLDFRSSHGGKDISSFPNLQPLPTSENLTVFLIPHSHCDPGWLETYLEYYQNTVRKILTNLYNFAIANADFKYIYAEVSFFSLWWKEQNEDVKNGMKKLATEGRFEFVQGGWVQADESSTHYFALINQMLDGHDWLAENFPEAVPKSGWAIDPFGLSPMMGYINKLFGLGAMHIQRVHYAVKNHLAVSKNLDFYWRQSWDNVGTTDMLTHLAPFFGYNSKYTCGPDPNVCDQYDFRILKNPRWFKPHPLLARTTPANVEERSLKILDQWRKKAALHSTNTVFIEIGDDFTYHHKDVLPEVHNNYKGIIDYINAEPSLNTRVDWGTLTDYFDTLRQQHDTSKLPVLSGDFFTYADREADYWSGYYTSRPFYKNLDRVLESTLRRAEIFLSFHRDTARSVEAVLVDARRALSLFQHHDAITGTAKPKVVKDYGARLFKAYTTCNDVTISVMKKLLHSEVSTFEPVSARPAFDQLSKFSVIGVNSDVVVANSLPRTVQNIQILAVSATQSLKVSVTGGRGLRQQVEPRIEYGDLHSDSKYIAFLADMEPLSIKSYKLASTPDEETKSTVEIWNGTPDSSLSAMFPTVTHSEFICHNIVIGSQTLSAVIECTSGRLVKVTRGESTIDIDQSVLLYTGKSGTYIFLPEGTPNILHTSSSRPKIVVVKGPVRHKAIVYLSSTLTLTYSINLSEGEAGQYLELELLTNLKINGDLVIRFKTSINSGDSLFTDLNGHTIQQHKYKAKLKTQGNFFPMPSTAFIQDASSRFTILSSEPHAVASLSPGSLEVVLDRRTIINDDRGLGEGIKDNLPTQSHLRILLEGMAAHPYKSDTGYVVENPSLEAHLAQQTLLNPAFVVHSAAEGAGLESVQLMNAIPCTEELVNLRYLNPDTSLLIRRKLGYTCHIKSSSYIGDTCLRQEGGSVSDWFVGSDDVQVRDHVMSPLHDQSGSSSGDKPMEFSSYYVTFSSHTKT